MCEDDVAGKHMIGIARIDLSGGSGLGQLYLRQMVLRMEAVYFSCTTSVQMAAIHERRYIKSQVMEVCVSRICLRKTAIFSHEYQGWWKNRQLVATQHATDRKQAASGGLSSRNTSSHARQLVSSLA